MNRTGRFSRTTKETSVELSLDIDGTGRAEVATPVGFLSHMLETVAKHGRLDLVVKAAGDTQIDAHHTVEDVGLAFGEALSLALGDRSGIERFGESTVPLDEALARTVVDLSGRPYIVFESPLDKELLLVTKDFPFALVEEFWKSAAFRGKLNLHVDVIRARNGHHAAEAVFKSAARALRIAAARTGSGIASTKGTLTA
ncbi:MAG TPA: imidazoleglycerol-phosphate dehydratase HisB [Thermoanaerobaculia bacterium]|nr:imidazoleglycerol-phosphate dehydratase HisB [Thermoanaerobaculia bacterium]